MAAPVVRNGNSNLGTRLREARLRHELSLEKVSDLTGLSISMISKIERGVTSPSMRSLLALSNGLNVKLDMLFEPPADQSHRHEQPENEELVVRASARRRLDFGAKRLVKEHLTPEPLGTLELLLITLAPGGSTGDDVFSHKGEEGGLVLTGVLELWVDDKKMTLYPGDSFSFCSERPHRYRNAAEVETKVLWANTPPVY